MNACCYFANDKLALERERERKGEREKKKRKKERKKKPFFVKTFTIIQILLTDEV